MNGSTSGKNRGRKTMAAAVPYRKKSYHSMVVPIVLATIASIRDRREGVTDAGCKSRDSWGTVSSSERVDYTIPWCRTQRACSEGECHENGVPVRNAGCPVGAVVDGTSGG